MGWIENDVNWSDPDGGTPNMGSAYFDSSGNFLKPYVWSGSHPFDDQRNEYNYAQPSCKSSGSNLKNVYVKACVGYHN
jgi:hypothetical protein